MTDPIDLDHLNRTALLAVHDGSAPTLDAAVAAQQQSRLKICAGPDTCAKPSGQAALLTAVLTAVRAFGHVTVTIPDTDITITGGVFRGRSLHEVIAEEGAHLRDTADPNPLECRLVVLIGNAPAAAPPDALHATWSAWKATVTPTPRPDAINDEVCVLAAITAGALAVAEAFARLRHQSGSDAGYRTLVLDLWNPASANPSNPPDLAYAPHAWWLLGLGHLGQAHAWAISWLPYPIPGDVEIVLQDTDHVTPANHSTGLLTPRRPTKILKTRVVSPALEGAGFTTRMIERRLGSDLRAAGESHVALLGVDNLDTRRLTSNVGWPLAVDVGLGSGPQDFSSMLLRRFPGQTSSQDIDAWKTPPPPTLIPATAAFAALTQHPDQCGVVELAGKAVGASFVGAVAACLAISETIRDLHGGRGHDLLTIDLLTDTARCSSAARPIEPVSAPLKRVLSPPEHL